MIAGVTIDEQEIPLRETEGAPSVLLPDNRKGKPRPRGVRAYL